MQGILTLRRVALQPLIQVVLGSLLLALSAQLAFFLPFSPVPLSMQTFAVLLLGATLGPKRGVWAVALYLIEGASGLPFFAGGYAGYAVLIGNDAGYLFGMLFEAYLAGFAVRATSHSLLRLTGMLLACTVQLGLGCLYFSAWVGWHALPIMGLLPFIPGEILKAVVVVYGVKSRLPLCR